MITTIKVTVTVEEIKRMIAMQLGIDPSMLEVCIQNTENTKNDN